MEEEICGTVNEIYFDKKVKELNLELVKVSDKHNNFRFEIHFQDHTKKNKSRNILKLHIKEAVELKSVIDTLVIDMYEDLMCERG